MSEQDDPTAGHSPLPWNDAWTTPSVWDDDGVAVVRPLAGASKEDAALIVREVNEAPKLRAEVERLRGTVRHVLDFMVCECAVIDDVCLKCASLAALNPEDPSDG